MTKRATARARALERGEAAPRAFTYISRELAAKVDEIAAQQRPRPSRAALVGALVEIGLAHWNARP